MNPIVWPLGARAALIVLVAVVPAGLLILWQARPFASDQQAAPALAADSMAARTSSTEIAPLVQTPASSPAALATPLIQALPDGHPAVGPTSGTQSKAAAAEVTTVDVEVVLEGSAASLPAAARVYVFVRTPDSRMPLAVEQFAPGSLPARVSFAIPVAGQAALEVVARLTLDGGVRRQAGDSETVLELGDRSVSARPAQLVLSVPAG